MPELRKDPIIERWVIIATERSRRPIDLKCEDEPVTDAFDPFLPGNEDKTPPELAQRGRPLSAPANSSGWRVRAVPNKFPALIRENQSDGEFSDETLPHSEFFARRNGIGAHEVVIESPRLDWDFADATIEEARDILEIYVERLQALQADERLRHTLIFRNVGTAAGASMAHPHSQIIALPLVPAPVKEALAASQLYFAEKERCIFCDILCQEIANGARIVEESELFVVTSSYAARFPFETKIFPRRHSHDFAQISEDEIVELSVILPRNFERLHRVLGKASYNMNVQSAPHESNWTSALERQNVARAYHWYIEILPRVTKIAGFELGTGCFINPIAPESATKCLRQAL